MSASLIDRVNRKAKDLESDDSKPFHERNILEVRYEVSQRGTVTEVIAVLTVGGPRIEVECLSGIVHGAWSGETYRRIIDSEEVREYGRLRANEFENRID